MKKILLEELSKILLSGLAADMVGVLHDVYLKFGVEIITHLFFELVIVCVMEDDDVPMD